MDIFLNITGQVKVYDMTNIGDVQTTGSNLESTCKTNGGVRIRSGLKVIFYYFIEPPHPLSPQPMNFATF